MGGKGSGKNDNNNSSDREVWGFFGWVLGYDGGGFKFEQFNSQVGRDL